MADTCKWIGASKSLKASLSASFPAYASYETMELTLSDGTAFRCSVGDYVTVNSEKEDELFVGRVNQLYEFQGKKALVQWMYRGDDLKKLPVTLLDPNELIYTSHCDRVFATTITGLCKVAFMSSQGIAFTTQLAGDFPARRWPVFVSKMETYETFKSVKEFSPARLRELEKEYEALRLWFKSSTHESTVTTKSARSSAPAVITAASKRGVRTKKTPAFVSADEEEDDDNDVVVIHNATISKSKRSKLALLPSASTVPKQSKAATSKPVPPSPQQHLPLPTTTTTTTTPSLLVGEYQGPLILEPLWALFQKGKNSFTNLELLESLGFLYIASQTKLADPALLLVCPPFILRILNEMANQGFLQKICRVLFPSSQTSQQILATLVAKAGEPLLPTLQALEALRPGAVLNLSLAMGTELGNWFFPQRQPSSVFGQVLLRGDGFRSCPSRFMNQEMVLPLDHDDVCVSKSVSDLVVAGFTQLVGEDFQFGYCREGDFVFGFYPAPGEICVRIRIKSASGGTDVLYVPKRPRLGLVRALMRAKNKSVPELQGKGNDLDVLQAEDGETLL
ncbi:hypothetical protein BASA81_005615 [Batrachochytrium salamandrivorans]|nr:hypothetical protein BASA81_005615 [Batrachochytrium salamandrivorans]